MKKNNDEKNSLNSLNNLYLKSPTKYNIFTGLNIHLNMNIEENYKLLVKCMLNTIIYKESNDDRKHTIKTLIPLVENLFELLLLLCYDITSFFDIYTDEQFINYPINDFIKISANKLNVKIFFNCKPFNNIPNDVLIMIIIFSVIQIT